ncbi:966_t:CDS:2 [Scutellospora calospora]|uniref:966_t:CDS:1 n=1 Tax=Scutellospora calospora TaxID=85575 RepID=A0ACA9LF38_9GLOM|nr:966_t:CDS:2 [Scutellospora calospora]
MGNGTFISGLTDAIFSDNVDYGEHFTANGNYGSKFGTGLRLNSRQIWPLTSIEWTIALKAVVMEIIFLEKRNIENDNSQATIDAWGKVNDLDNRLMFGVNPDINNSLNVLDSLYLEYKLPYPINVIITPSSLEIYNRLFVFLLRILRMRIVINYVHRLLRDRHLFDDDDTAKDKKIGANISV